MRRVKLNPTQWQKEVLRRFNGQCRFTYNAVVASRKGQRRPKLNFQELRTAFVTAKSTERDNEERRTSRNPKKDVDGKKIVSANPFLTRNDFLAYTPVCVRQGAVKQYVAAEKAAWRRFQDGAIRHFDMKFRSRRLEKSWTLHIDKRQIRYDSQTRRLVILKESLCSEKAAYKPSLDVRDAAYRRPKKDPSRPPPEETHVRFFDKLPFDGTPQHDCSIHYAYGQYWLQVPYERERHRPSGGQALRPAVGIDPGGRDPLATFTTEGRTGLHGTKETDKLEEVWRRKEVLRSRLGRDVPRDERQRLKRRLRRAWHQYEDLKSNLHHHLACSLAKAHSAIFLPEMPVEWVKRTRRPNAVRRILAFGHGKFRERLRDKCWRFRTWLPDVDERYTTQSCSSCGRLHPDIGSSKVFDCPHCPLRMDRDLNSAKNMLLKHSTFCAIPPASDGCLRRLGDDCLAPGVGAFPP